MVAEDLTNQIETDPKRLQAAIDSIDDKYFLPLFSFCNHKKMPNGKKDAEIVKNELVTCLNWFGKIMGIGFGNGNDRKVLLERFIDRVWKMGAGNKEFLGITSQDANGKLSYKEFKMLMIWNAIIGAKVVENVSRIKSFSTNAI